MLRRIKKLRIHAMPQSCSFKTSPLSRIIALCACIVLLVLFDISPVAAAKTDVVILGNGDRITGEIKQLNRGKLEYSTDDMGTIYIEWKKIARISSRDSFEIELASGQKFFGRIQTADEDGRMIVSGIGARGHLDMGWVVHITPLKPSFLQQLKGYVDLGFSYVKTSDDATLTLNSKLNYRTVKYLTALDISSYYNLRKKEVATTRNSLGVSFNRFFASRYFGRVNNSYEENSELNLDLRILIGGGAGRYIVQTNNKLFSTYLGLAANTEWYSDVEGKTTDLEGVGSVEYEWFRYEDPKLDLLTTLAVYPNLTGAKRWRVDFEVRFSYEIFKDFTISISGYDNYDSNPPTGDTATNDWGTTLSVGLKLK